MHLGFKTLKGKYYSLQQSTDLTTPSSWTAVTPAAGVSGTGLTATLDAPYAVDTYFRVLVQDLDSDADGVSDWAEIKLGIRTR